MSEFLDAFCQQAAKNPDARAFFNARGQQLTYGELEAQANSLASFLHESFSTQQPVALIGHKEPEMLVGMIAAMKAGFAYVPLDSSLPSQRILGILGQLGDAVIIEAGPDSLVGLSEEAREASEDDPLDSEHVVTHAQLKEIISKPVDSVDSSWSVKGTDPHYILFTSGSTGTPKGVVQPARSMDCTYRYFSRFIPEGEQHAFFNRAHYSFDLSIFDLAIALPFGHSLFALTEDVEDSLAASFDALHEADPALWVSTPSYLDMCLVDPAFSPELLPSLKSVVVCGETLHNTTARRLHERFPDVALYNTYGPTEAQGAITDVLITPELANAEGALPVGSISPFNELWIVDKETRKRLDEGERGEVVIAGGTIATGYFGRDDLTARAFGVTMSDSGKELPYYFTGDEGYVDEDGQLHFLGRLDLQVKVNGYRIELEEIEETLKKTDEVLHSCVVPVERHGSNVALTAHVVVRDGIPEDRATTKLLKEKLKETLPVYMIPRTFVYHDALPSNANGKIDRKALAAWSSRPSSAAKREETRA